MASMVECKQPMGDGTHCSRPVGHIGDCGPFRTLAPGIGNICVRCQKTCESPKATLCNGCANMLLPSGYLNPVRSTPRKLPMASQGSLEQASIAPVVVGDPVHRVEVGTTPEGSPAGVYLQLNGPVIATDHKGTTSNIAGSTRLQSAHRVARDRVTNKPLSFSTVTIFLNRACPRTCYQCGIADNSRKALKADQWLKVFDNLNRVFGATFYLFLGTEPLLLGQGLIDIVRGMKERGYFYGWYSTSPEPLFTKWRDKLVEAGIDNWSAGIDNLPHLAPMDPSTDKKVRESIAGLQWMAARGVSTFTLTTIHKKNLTLVPEILEWCQRNIPGVGSAMNFVEWQKEPQYDFFSKPEDMAPMLWDGSDAERNLVKKTMLEIAALSRVEGNIIQCPDDFALDAHRHYDKLDQHCQGIIGPSVDADGTMRLCGYNRGDKVMDMNALDLTPDRFEEFMEKWEDDLWKCKGCFWSFVPLLNADPRILDIRSDYFRENWTLKKTEGIRHEK